MSTIFISLLHIEGTFLSHAVLDESGGGGGVSSLSLATSFLHVNFSLHFGFACLLYVSGVCLRGSFHNVWGSEDSL